MSTPMPRKTRECEARFNPRPEGTGNRNRRLMRHEQVCQNAISLPRLPLRADPRRLPGLSGSEIPNQAAGRMAAIFLNGDARGPKRLQKFTRKYACPWRAELAWQGPPGLSSPKVPT